MFHFEDSNFLGTGICVREIIMACIGFEEIFVVPFQVVFCPL